MSHKCRGCQQVTNAMALCRDCTKEQKRLIGEAKSAGCTVLVTERGEYQLINSDGLALSHVHPYRFDALKEGLGA